MLCAFCPPTIMDDFYRIPEKSPTSSADKMYRACESKDQTHQEDYNFTFFQIVSKPLLSSGFRGSSVQGSVLTKAADLLRQNAVLLISRG